MAKDDIKKARAENAERIANIAYSGGGHIGQDDLETAFENGAEWRINSVWHDANEEPKYDEFFLYENVIQAFHVDCIFPSQDEAFVWDDYVKDWCLMRWAYIKDLIPNKEE